MSALADFAATATVLGAIVIGLAVMKSKIAGGGSADLAGDRFKAKPMLTANELEFLSRLEAAVPELRICPQVAMGAILDPGVPRSDRKTFMRLRGMFAQKIIDFVVQDRATGTIVAIVELDDRTHSGEKDARRDAMLASAGYKVVRWQSKDKPDITAIRSELAPQALSNARVE
jgi:hypothetical protein